MMIFSQQQSNYASADRGGSVEETSIRKRSTITEVGSDPDPALVDLSLGTGAVISCPRRFVGERKPN